MQSSCHWLFRVWVNTFGSSLCWYFAIISKNGTTKFQVSSPHIFCVRQIQRQRWYYLLCNGDHTIVTYKGSSSKNLLRSPASQAKKWLPNLGWTTRSLRRNQSLATTTLTGIGFVKTLYIRLIVASIIFHAREYYIHGALRYCKQSLKVQRKRPGSGEPPLPSLIGRRLSRTNWNSSCLGKALASSKAVYFAIFLHRYIKAGGDERRTFRHKRGLGAAAFSGEYLKCETIAQQETPGFPKYRIWFVE